MVVPLLALLPVALLCLVQIGAATFPATVEVDLIFPRNATYAPSALFPIVFAFQNAALAPTLDPSFDLLLWDGTFTNATSLLLDVRWNNFSSEPTYVYTYVTRLNATADGNPAPYSLSWGFGAGNCSNQSGKVVTGGGVRYNSVVFTIQNGAQQPDLMTATADSASCTNASHFAFNVTGTLGVQQPDKYDGRDTCAVFSDVQSMVPGDPCAVHMDSATASNISAALVATNCASFRPVVSCPSQPNAAMGGRNAAQKSFIGVFSTLITVVVAIQLV